MKYVKELANMFWVRPENALWVTKVMQKMDHIDFEGPNLDLMSGALVHRVLVESGRAVGVECSRAGKTETMGLADHGIAADIADDARDLARAVTLAPELGEDFNLVVGPCHVLLLPETWPG